MGGMRRKGGGGVFEMRMGPQSKSGNGQDGVMAALSFGGKSWDRGRGTPGPPYFSKRHFMTPPR